MKLNITYKIKIFFILLILSISFTQYVFSSDTLRSQTNKSGPEEIKEGYYLVVGVFSKYENALQHYNSLKAKGFETEISFSKAKQAYYNYISYSESLDYIKNKLVEVRHNKDLGKAWIMTIENISEETEKIPSHIKENKINETKVVKVVPVHQRSKNNVHTVKDVTLTHNTYKLFIHVHDDELRQIPAQIKVVNGEDAKVVGNIEAHKDVALNIPKMGNQKVQLQCEVFGFQKTEFDLDLADPVNPLTMAYVKKIGDKIVIDYPLKTYKKGDISVMYNVFFFPRTNVLRSKSNYEMQTLLKILKENPTMEIKIHGHTNGNFLYYKMTKLKKSSVEYFTLDETETIRGGSNKLSLLRCATIKSYLIRNGISNDRIKVKGWGGKKMIHKEHSPQCEYNVRVEVEILKE
jgi:outer membrane protein OmpA-like peptidoglycan-associated protein